MTKRGGNHDPRQPALFDAPGAPPPLPGAYNFDAELRAALSKAIADCGKTRADIAAQMEELLGDGPDYPVSKATLDAWTAPSRTDWRFPLLYLPAFVAVTGATWLIELIARHCGLIAMTGDQAAHAQLGHIRAERERLKLLEREALARIARARR